MFGLTISVDMNNAIPANYLEKLRKYKGKDRNIMQLIQFEKIA